MVSFAFFVSVALAARQVAGLYPVTGAQGGVYPRYEIRELKANYAQQYSLYIQALTQFQNTSTSDLGSYYQITGIHGFPNAVWDGVDGNGGGLGYCVHGMNIFPTWHRPYVALYEQRINAIARTIAAQYTSDQANWIKAATQLRNPYYDWIIAPASGKSAYPDEVFSATVAVTTPTGLKMLANPLYSYKFQQPVPGFPSPFDSWPSTLRWPNSSDANAVSQPLQARSTIDQNRISLRDGVYQMFINCKDFSLLSDYRNDRPSSCPNSLEGFHGTYHVFIGGTDDPYGHMTWPPTAGFDPIFMLHHTSVDRLLAMWQVLYPKSWVVNTAAQSSTKTIAQGSVQGPTSPLTPFRNTAGAFWTSNSIRSTNSLNYTYTDVTAAGGSSSTMSNIIGALYGPSATRTAASSSSKRAARRHAEAEAEPQTVSPNILASNIYQYSANLVTTRYGLGGSYVVLVFFGNPVSSDPATWLYDPNLVGSAGVFVDANGKAGDKAVNSAAISLTSALARLSSNNILASLLPAIVVPYLQSNLQWRVVQAGKEIDINNVPDFKISVVSSVRQQIDQALSDLGFPTWDNFQVLSQITAGKPGGATA